jgi:hypothetical protein
MPSEKVIVFLLKAELSPLKALSVLMQPEREWFTQ